MLKITKFCDIFLGQKTSYFCVGACKRKINPT